MKDKNREVAAATVEFEYRKDKDELHFDVIQGSFGPSAAQATKAREIMKNRGVGKTRFYIYDDGDVKEV